MLSVSKRIQHIFDILGTKKPYNGDVQVEHYSVAIQNGKIISPLLNNYHRTKVLGVIKGTIHAEMAVINFIVNSHFIRKNINNTRLVLKKMGKIDIMVWRRSSIGVRNSKPCKECTAMMNKYNIRKVYYSMDDGHLRCEKTKNIKTTHLSRFSRATYIV